MDKEMRVQIFDERLYAEASYRAVYSKNCLLYSYLQGKTTYKSPNKKKHLIAHFHHFKQHCIVCIDEELKTSGIKVLLRAASAIYFGYIDSPFIYRIQVTSNHINVRRGLLCTFILRENTSSSITAAGTSYIIILLVITARAITALDTSGG